MANFKIYGADVSRCWVVLASQRGSVKTFAGETYPVIVAQSDDLSSFVLTELEEEPFDPAQHEFAEEFLPPGAVLFESALEAFRFMASSDITTEADCFLVIQVV